jgi:hypothetical protein
MDGDGGGGWTPSPWCDVVISVSPLPLVSLFAAPRGHFI